MGANTWWVTVPQLLPVLLPRPPSGHTSPCSLPSDAPGTERLPRLQLRTFPEGRGRWMESDAPVTLTPPSAASIFSRGRLQERGAPPGSGTGWLPARWRGYWQRRRISSPLGPVHALAGRQQALWPGLPRAGPGNPVPGQLIPRPKERAPAGDPAPNPAQSKGDGLRGRPSPWRFAASWFPELA